MHGLEPSYILVATLDTKNQGVVGTVTGQLQGIYNNSKAVISN
jgi:hypothetical protein